jgi:hypothetical protein
MKTINQIQTKLDVLGLTINLNKKYKYVEVIHRILIRNGYKVIFDVNEALSADNVIKFCGVYYI